MLPVQTADFYDAFDTGNDIQSPERQPPGTGPGWAARPGEFGFPAGELSN